MFILPWMYTVALGRWRQDWYEHKSFLPLSSPMKSAAALINDIRAGFRKKIPAVRPGHGALPPTQ